MEVRKMNAVDYKSLLKEYIETLDEKSLYRAEQVSKSFIKESIPPEEIINVHSQALTELYPNINKEFFYSLNFLLEAMISYGLAHQEFQALREEQLKLRTEIAVAAKMQETLLATSKPYIEGLDIGAISVPAEQMNGDYHHFVKGEQGTFGIAIADVIGKGIPAALCMSMIKYSMESFANETTKPNIILRNLNRVVEQNVDSSMFITMFYGQYLPLTRKFLYASAGHEPGFFYNSSIDEFIEIETEGLVLGVLPNSEYEQYELTINSNDMIILLTDGVTECRCGDRFIERKEVLEVIRENIYLPAQELVNQVYKYFERLQDFQLKDDFTLIVIRKKD